MSDRPLCLIDHVALRNLPCLSLAERMHYLDAAQAPRNLMADEKAFIFLMDDPNRNRTWRPHSETDGRMQYVAPIVDAHDDLEPLVAGEMTGGHKAPLPGLGDKPPTERP